MDERNKQIALHIIAVMYFFTVIAITGIVIYRQLGLGQDISSFEDIAIVLTVNSIFLISALLYFGAIPIRRLKIPTILAVYAVFVVLGSAFTYAKYNIFMSAGLSVSQLIDKLFIIFAITGLLMAFFVLFSFLGQRRLEKELD